MNNICIYNIYIYYLIHTSLFLKKIEGMNSFPKLHFKVSNSPSASCGCSAHKKKQQALTEKKHTQPAPL